MERYINSFATENDILTALENGELLKPYVAYIEDADRIDWNSKEIVDYTTEYLTFNILSAGTINWTASNTNVTKTIDYKLNNGEWVSITSTTTGAKINVNTGDKIQFRGNNAAYGISGFEPKSSTFSGSTAGFEVEGNIMSLINSTDFSTLTTLDSTYTFVNLFSNCTGLTSAKNLILPATTLAMGCYWDMFAGCTSLITAPALPANSLARECYDSMFQNCKSLTTAPSLPATTLAMYCYYQMFDGCTSLTAAPALPATTLASGCYNSMFQNCKSLTTAPELPATTLIGYCYQGMFNDCKNLNYIKCLATDISAERCTNFWAQGVAATGTFVKAAGMTSWPTGSDGIPTNWTVQDA